MAHQIGNLRAASKITADASLEWRIVRETIGGCGKRRVCHPEPVLFAGEGSAVRKKAKEKADSSPSFKNRAGFGMTYFSSFSAA
jgi:hypothetical protein